MLLYEAMSTVNSHPLTITAPNSLEPLTSNHLLTMKSTVPLPPPGKFVAEDLSFGEDGGKSIWLTLHSYRHAPRRNVKHGDVVIVKEEGVLVLRTDLQPSRTTGNVLFVTVFHFTLQEHAWSHSWTRAELSQRTMFSTSG